MGFIFSLTVFLFLFLFLFFLTFFAKILINVLIETLNINSLFKPDFENSEKILPVYDYAEIKQTVFSAVNLVTQRVELPAQAYVDIENLKFAQSIKVALAEERQQKVEEQAAYFARLHIILDFAHTQELKERYFHWISGKRFDRSVFTDFYTDIYNQFHERFIYSGYKHSYYSYYKASFFKVSELTGYVDTKLWTWKKLDKDFCIKQCYDVLRKYYAYEINTYLGGRDYANFMKNELPMLLKQASEAELQELLLNKKMLEGAAQDAANQATEVYNYCRVAPWA